jgi:hypothetical protein
MSRVRVVLLVAATSGVLVGCGGVTQTRQEAATNTVCNARAAIGSVAANVSGYVVAPGTPDDVRMSARAIGEDLVRIGVAQRDLPPTSAMQVGTAAEAFRRQFRPLLPALAIRSTDLSPPRYKLFTAAQQRATPVYQRTLGTLPCT